ncbi:Y-family DNA polymerase [Chitinophaga japonensis]|uniref:Protein ImuB n=1 Tax=Chitinophaga japonensis TaxID=104662 RepID=A0A562SS41_CHIJA|nr:DNA polymerase Y family protein [Chitinophaga japonensis]TWI84061.1 protein ImuB [Chitinophaga japonensis]
MAQRFVTIWLYHLVTDWLTIRRPDLRQQPFVLAAPDHGRMVITAASTAAQAQGIYAGMVLADARAILPALQVFNDRPGLAEELLQALAKWCIRYTPFAAIDPPDGLILDASGCAHLWGGEAPYLEAIITRLQAFGYQARAAMAGTIGTAWAVSRFGSAHFMIDSGKEQEALLYLPPAALRLEQETVERLQKLGLVNVSHFINMPRTALRRRFGQELLQRLDQALGREEESIQPLEPVQPFQERLPCLEPILTATGIEIALQRLLEALCNRLRREGKGLRTAVLKAFRVDGRVVQVSIGTNGASHNADHLFKLFAHKIPTIEPALGIELFVLEAPKTDALSPQQETLWTGGCGLESPRLSELVDRLANKLGAHCIHRYLPQEHYWPERSARPAASLDEKPATAWRSDVLRPVRLLPEPERITVAAPIPDYPPMLFRYQGQVHRVRRADGPERIEREWWLEAGPHRDYYVVEDEAGRRYWIFRSGHYDGSRPHWFLHGFFA